MELFWDRRSAGKARALRATFSLLAFQSAARLLPGLDSALDMAGNVLKEFWPDIYGRLARKHHP